VGVVTAAGGAGVVETRSAVLFFVVGDRAYKLKKPVDLGFLDFRSRAAREDACHREVELNRRLASDLYLSVADISGPDGELCAQDEFGGLVPYGFGATASARTFGHGGSQSSGLLCDPETGLVTAFACTGICTSPSGERCS